MPIELLTSENPLANKDEVVTIYRAAYSAAPYDEPEERVQQFAEGWSERVANPGFVLVLARLDGTPAGMAYGWPTRPEGKYTVALREQLGEKADRWMRDAFEFVDFAVTPTCQGQGIGGALYRALFAHVRSEVALLYTHQSDTAAYGMYLQKGWEVLARDIVFKSGKRFVLMGKRLR